MRIKDIQTPLSFQTFQLPLKSFSYSIIILHVSSCKLLQNLTLAHPVSAPQIS